MCSTCEPVSASPSARRSRRTTASRGRRNTSRISPPAHRSLRDAHRRATPATCCRTSTKTVPRSSSTTPDECAAPGIPPRPDGARVYEIAMFGGSTMEGLGAVDDETIPRTFPGSPTPSSPGDVVYHVTNYGVSGYTFTQSVMKLVTLLRDGHHFDAVIFYGGDNDIDYAYNLGEVGALESEDLVRTRLEGSVVDRIRRIREGTTQRLRPVPRRGDPRPQHRASQGSPDPVSPAAPRCRAFQERSGRRARRRSACRRHRPVLRPVARAGGQHRGRPTTFASSTSGSQA